MVWLYLTIGGARVRQAPAVEEQRGETSYDPAETHDVGHKINGRNAEDRDQDPKERGHHWPMWRMTRAYF